jgi:hypothetical protein
MCAGVVGPVVYVEAAGQREMTGEESSLQDHQAEEKLKGVKYAC